MSPVAAPTAVAQTKADPPELAGPRSALKKYEDPYVAPKEWKKAMNQFAILYPDRFTPSA